MLRKPRHARRGDGKLPDRHARKRLLAAVRADVDVQMRRRQLGGGVPVRADDAHFAVPKRDMLGDHFARGHAARRAYAQEAVLIRVDDHQRDVIHVGREHDALARAVALLHRDEVAHRVGAHAVRMRAQRTLDDRAHVVLAARRAIGGQHLCQKLHIHCFPTSSSSASVSAPSASMSESLHRLAGEWM